MTCTGTIIRLNPGSDWTADAVMPDGAGGAADLTGFTASIADATDELPGAVAVSIPTPAAGLTRRVITWQAGWPLVPRVLGKFRERYVLGAQDNSTNLVTVMVDDTVTEIIAIGAALAVAALGVGPAQWAWVAVGLGYFIAWERLWQRGRDLRDSFDDAVFVTCGAGVACLLWSQDWPGAMGAVLATGGLLAVGVWRRM